MNDHETSAQRFTRRALLAGAVQAVAMLAAACAPLPPPAESPGASATPPPLPPAAPTSDSTCAAKLQQVTAPTPIPYPGYTQIEPSTGLHVTAPPQVIDVATYRLEIKGKVERRQSLTYDEIRCLPRLSAAVEILCPGFFIDKSNLAGASLASALALAGPLPEGKQVLFHGVDGRSEFIPLDEAQGSAYFLAYEWEGEALPASHGFPVRVALPGRIGGNWVKWLKEIEVM